MIRRFFPPHSRVCPCEAWVETPPNTEGLPCPAMHDAYNPGEEIAGWKVAHRVERLGDGRGGVKVWSWWERAPSSEPCPECGGEGVVNDGSVTCGPCWGTGRRGT